MTKCLPEVSSPPLTSEPLVSGSLVTNGTASSSSSSNGEVFPSRKLLSNGTSSSSVTSSSNGIPIQKVLATTRIQQEIEEQTQREIALRAAGSIKTISHERTDLKVVPTKLSGPAPLFVDHHSNHPIIPETIVEKVVQE